MAESSPLADQLEGITAPMNTAEGETFLQALESRAKYLPRFLFRGFHGRSGRAHPGVNSLTGYVPHAFLEDPNIPWSVETYSRMELHQQAWSHITNQTGGPLTRFSSWSANFESAVHFALGFPGFADTDYWTWFDRPEYLPAYIAVIDTHTIPNRSRRIFHLPSLGDDDKYRGVPVEYIIHGPLRVADGVDFRAVDIAALRNALGCQRWPICVARARVPHPVGEEDVREASIIANLFRRTPGDNTEDQDMPLAVMAAELGRQQWPTPPPRQAGWPEQDHVEMRWMDQTGTNAPGRDLTAITKYMGKYMVTKTPRAPLFNSSTLCRGFPQLGLMMDLCWQLQQDAKNQPPEPDQGQLAVNVTIQNPGENLSAVHNCDAPTRRTVFEPGYHQLQEGQLSQWFDGMTGGSVAAGIAPTDFSAIPNMRAWVLSRNW